MMRMRDIPREILVGDSIYTVHFVRHLVDEGENIRGLYDPVDKWIKIEMRLGAEVRMQTFLHEVLHTIEFEYDLEIDHALIHKLEVPLYRLLVDNLMPNHATISGSEPTQDREDLMPKARRKSVRKSAAVKQSRSKAAKSLRRKAASKVQQVSDGTGVFQPGTKAVEDQPAKRAVSHSKDAERMRASRAKSKAALHAVRLDQDPPPLTPRQTAEALLDQALLHGTSAVTHPPHYNKGQIEVWDYTTDQGMGFLEGNIVKYVSRWRHKDGVTDLEKARDYLNKLIDVAKQVPSVDNAVAYRPL